MNLFMKPEASAPDAGAFASGGRERDPRCRGRGHRGPRTVLRGANTFDGCAASCDDETGVPTGRSTSGRADGAGRCPRQHARAATRSVSWSSTCRRCAARPGPTRGSGRTAPDRGPAVRERGRSRLGPGSIPPRSHRGWSLRAIGGTRSETVGTARPNLSRPDLGDDATLSSQLVPDRRGLDDEPAAGDVDLQGGMDESAPRAMLDESLDRLVDLPTPTNHVAACAQRKPVEVDCSGRGRGCRSCSLQAGHDAMAAGGPGMTLSCPKAMQLALERVTISPIVIALVALEEDSRGCLRGGRVDISGCARRWAL